MSFGLVQALLGRDPRSQRLMGIVSSRKLRVCSLRAVCGGVRQPPVGSSSLSLGAASASIPISDLESMSMILFAMCLDIYQRLMGIEPTSRAWEARVIAIIRQTHGLERTCTPVLQGLILSALTNTDKGNSDIPAVNSGRSEQCT